MPIFSERYCIKKSLMLFLRRFTVWIILKLMCNIYLNDDEESEDPFQIKPCWLFDNIKK